MAHETFDRGGEMSSAAILTFALVEQNAVQLVHEK